MTWCKAIAILIVGLVHLSEGCTRDGKECPDYTVSSIHADYEVRSYPSLKWVKTSVDSDSFRTSSVTLFMRLYRYITGKNDKDMNIDMTTPVRTLQIKEGSNSTYEMSFMIPSSLRENAPTPTDSRVRLESEPAMVYAVRQFPGYIVRRSTWEREAQALANSVADDTAVNTTWYYIVGYDSPFTLFNRRNEIWMVRSASAT